MSGGLLRMAFMSAARCIFGKLEDNVAVRDVICFFEANERGDHDRVAIFHVLSTAAIKVAVFFDELEGIGGPVLAACFDYVEMSDQQYWFVLARSVIPHKQILLA